MQMQVAHFNTPHPNPLRKTDSLPTLISTDSSSSASIESPLEEPYKLAARWVLLYHRKITRDTQYLAIAYLSALPSKGIILTHDNYEAVAMTTLLIAGKMNEIHPPKIASMIARCHMPVTKEEVIVLEARIIAAFDYDIAYPSTVYTHIMQILGNRHPEKLAECQKLLRLVISHKQVWQQGQEMLAYAIVYLIVPQLIRDMQLDVTPTIKMLAVKIYSIYQEAKWRHDKEKENLCGSPQ